MPPTIAAKLLEQAELRPASPAYYVKEGGTWQATDWATYADEVRSAGKALIALGLQVGQKVTILGFNRPEWVIVDVAAMAVGGAAAGVYTTCSAEEVQYIVHHAEAKVMLLEDEGQWEKVKESKRGDTDELPHLEHVVMMKGAPVIDDPMVMSWEDFMAKADGATDEQFDERLDALEPDGLATLIYTSGTTGPPKGVMLSNDNLYWTARVMQDLIKSDADDCTVSYLPLSHIAEQMMTIHGPSLCGASVYYAESIALVPENLKEVQPTLIFGVPRIWEKFYAGVTSKLGQTHGYKKYLVQWVRKNVAAYNAARLRGRKPGPMLSAAYWIAQKAVLGKLKAALGMGRVKIAVTGAAPISTEIIEFFSSLDIIISEVYGQSEDSGPTTFNVMGATKFGTVGQPIPGVEVKIASDDEILVRGRNVFLGYYKDEAATNEALIDGWLHSGDLGKIDEDGFLHITGRKKDIIITAGGKNIAPKNIEAALKNFELINEAVVIGDRRKFLSAVITIDPEACEKFVAAHHLDTDKKPGEHQEIVNEVQAAVDEVNKTLARVEQVKKFTILERNLTIEDGELTPTLKVKRKKVNEHFADQIEAMYK